MKNMIEVRKVGVVSIGYKEGYIEEYIVGI